MKNPARTRIAVSLIPRKKGTAAIVLGICLIVALAGQRAVSAFPDPEVGSSESGVLAGEWRFDLNPIHETSRMFGTTPALDELGPTVNDRGGEDDSDIEIIMGSDGIGVHGNPYEFFSGVWRVFDSTGAVERYRDTQCDQARGNIAVADLDADGANEYVGSTTSGHCIEVMDKDLNFIWTFPEPPMPGNLEFHSSPSVGDVDPGVGGLEIANLHRPTCDVLLWDGTPQDGVDEGVQGFTTLPGTSYSWSGTDGIDWDVLWTRDLPGNDCYSTTTMADVDNDRDMEVIAGVAGLPNGAGAVYVLDGATGAIEATFDTSGVQASVSVANLDRDRNLEMAVGDLGGTFYVFEWDGAIARTECLAALGSGIRSSAAIGDVDDDDMLEMIVGTDGGEVKALSSTCAAEWAFDTGSGQPVAASPVLADRGSVGTYQVEWPMFQHDRQRTGYYGAARRSLDVYVGGTNDYMYVLDGDDGSKIDAFTASGPIYGSAAVGDIDGDGCLEVTFQSWGEFSGGHTRMDRVWNVQDTGTPGTTCSDPPPPPPPPPGEADVEIVGWDVPQHLSLEVGTSYFFDTVKTVRRNDGPIEDPIEEVDVQVHKSMDVPFGMDGSLHVTHPDGEHISIPAGVPYRIEFDTDGDGTPEVIDQGTGPLERFLEPSHVVVVEGLPEPADPGIPWPRELTAHFLLSGLNVGEEIEVSEEFDVHCREFGFYNVYLSNSLQPIIDPDTGAEIPDYKPWNNHADASIYLECVTGVDVQAVSKDVFIDGDQVNLPDSDNDGLTNASETRIGSDPFAFDSDGDGFGDGHEVNVGTDPVSPLSTPPADSDGDGLSDLVEHLMGTATDNRDSDGDGYDDRHEFSDGSDPRDPDSRPPGVPWEDADGDGLSDFQEGLLGTCASDPCPSGDSQDSDGDGFGDGHEVHGGGYDPLDPASTPETDRDGDGLSDILEDRDADGTVDPGETDPDNRDSDGDGYGDGEEIYWGSNPLEPGSVPPPIPQLPAGENVLVDVEEVISLDADTDIAVRVHENLSGHPDCTLSFHVTQAFLDAGVREVSFFSNGGDVSPVDGVVLAPPGQSLAISFVIDLSPDDPTTLNEVWDFTCDEPGHRRFDLDKAVYPDDPGTFDLDLSNNYRHVHFVVHLYTEAPLGLDIDIKPGSDPNSVNPGSNGLIAVAILTTDDFDATTVDPETVRFGPAGAEKVHKRAHVEDADGDGDLDLVLHFRTQETGIALGDTEACLTGETSNGLPIMGCDSVRTVPPK